MELILKLVVTPCLIAVATLVARRWGAVRGGWIAGLPLVSGPLSAFLAVEQGPLFASQAAHAALLGLVGVSAFCVVYARVAERRGPRVSLASGVGAYFAVAWGLSHVTPGLVPSALLVVLLTFSAYAATGAPAGNAPNNNAPRWDLPLRMGCATVVVLIITGCAPAFGATWSGLLSPFPVFASVMAFFSQRQGGPSAAHHLLLGIIVGSLASAAFLIVTAALLPREGLAPTYALASCLALAVSLLSLATIRKKANFRNSS